MNELSQCFLSLSLFFFEIGEGGFFQVQVEAVRTLGKVSLWSGEPYRLHISVFLRTLAEPESKHLSLASAAIPIIAVIKRFYYAQVERNKEKRRSRGWMDGWMDG